MLMNEAIDVLHRNGYKLINETTDTIVEIDDINKILHNNIKKQQKNIADQAVEQFQEDFSEELENHYEDDYENDDEDDNEDYNEYDFDAIQQNLHDGIENVYDDVINDENNKMFSYLDKIKMKKNYKFIENKNQITFDIDKNHYVLELIDTTDDVYDLGNAISNLDLSDAETDVVFTPEDIGLTTKWVIKSNNKMIYFKNPNKINILMKKLMKKL